MTEIVFFPTPDEFGNWLSDHFDKKNELWVGFYKKATKIPSITWPESVAEAICYGWIDGIRKSIDDKSYMIRFTPRRKTSIWSAVNIQMVANLKSQGRMKTSGIEAFERRKDKKSEIYSYEQQKVQLDKSYESEIKKEAKAWAYYDTLAPSYKKATIHWVMSAKKETTRLKRLAILIESSKNGLKIPPIRRN